MSYYFYMHWYFLIYSYYLTVSNELSLTALQYEEFALSFGSLKPGEVRVNLKIYPKSENELLFLYALVFPYIFLLFDCFKWVLIHCIVKCKVHSVLWVLLNLKIYPKSENELLFLYALVFPYIFLLFDCFKWALIDCIAIRRVHSEL